MHPLKYHCHLVYTDVAWVYFPVVYSPEVGLCTCQGGTGVAISQTNYKVHPGPPAVTVVHLLCLFVSTLLCHQHTLLLWSCS